MTPRFLSESTWTRHCHSERRQEAPGRRWLRGGRGCLRALRAAYAARAARPRRRRRGTGSSPGGPGSATPPPVSGGPGRDRGLHGRVWIHSPNVLPVSPVDLLKTLPVDLLHLKNAQFDSCPIGNRPPRCGQTQLLYGSYLGISLSQSTSLAATCLASRAMPMARHGLLLPPLSFLSPAHPLRCNWVSPSPCRGQGFVNWVSPSPCRGQGCSAQSHPNFQTRNASPRR